MIMFLSNAAEYEVLVVFRGGVNGRHSAYHCGLRPNGGVITHQLQFLPFGPQA